MANHDDYVALEPVISQLPPDEVKAPDFPVEVLGKEGEQLADWVRADKAEFDKVNFDWAIVETLGTRVGAAIHAEAIWCNARMQQQDSLKQFQALRKDAETLRGDVLAALSFACFGNVDVERTISDIREGNSNADLVLDLTRIYALAMQYLEQLRAINFDLTILDRVAQTAGVLGELLGKSDADKLHDSKEKVMRDKAYVYLKTAIDKIRVAGKFVCRGNPERLAGYFSEYQQAVNRKRKNSKGQEPPVVAQ